MISVLWSAVAVTGYAFSLGVWAYVVIRRRQLTHMASRLDHIPEEDRIRALEAVYGPIPEVLDADNWVRERRNRLILIAFLATLIVSIPLTVLAFADDPVDKLARAFNLPTTDPAGPRVARPANGTTSTSTDVPPTPPSSVDDVEVGSPIDGTVAEVLVTPNAQVQKGDVLARVRRADLIAEAATAQAESENANSLLKRLEASGRHQADAARHEIERATALHRLSQQRYVRIKRIYDEGRIPLEMVEDASQQVIAADAVVATARERNEIIKETLQMQIAAAKDAARTSKERANVAQARAAMLELTAPVAGVVVRAMRPGAVVSVQSGKPVVVLRTST